MSSGTATAGAAQTDGAAASGGEGASPVAAAPEDAELEATDTQLPEEDASAQTVSRADFLSSMKTALPKLICSKGEYFRQCFDVDEKTCLGTASRATHVCLTQYEPQLPEMLKQPEDGRRWGSEIGSCTGRTFETVLLKQKKKSKKCDDPNAWF